MTKLSRRFLRALLIFPLCLSWNPQADAAKHQITYETLIGLRANPLGLGMKFTPSYQYQLYKSESPLYEKNYFGLDLSLLSSPAFTNIGMGLSIQPLSVLKLSASAHFVQYFGSFNRLQSFARPDVKHTDDTLKANGEAGQNYASFGTELALGAKLQGKLGPIALVSNFQLKWYNMDLNDGDIYFYESYIDGLIQNQGWCVINDTDLLYVSGFGLVAGVRYSMNNPIYSTKKLTDLGLSESPHPGNHRIGPMLAYRFYDKQESTGFDQPTLILLVNWYLEHPYRAGGDTAQSFPYIALAFKFSGDLYRAKN
ncbi:MAG: hypothetical protein VYA34_16995 [Myxococcota bacterium]|nr:hypothetical protein [Myxococcota bacterium]